MNFVDPSGLDGIHETVDVVDSYNPWLDDAGNLRFLFESLYGSSSGGLALLPFPVYEGGDLGSVDVVATQDGFPGGSPNPLAQLGPCAELVVPGFGNINQAASTLLNNTYGKGAEAAYGRLSIYERAVFLNTSAAAASVGVNLSNAKFDGFYQSNKPGNLPYGIYVTGASGKLEGRHAAIGSVELDTKRGRTQMDVDLYKGGLRGAMGKHGEEVDFNKRHNRPTYPGDVASQLRARGVNSGVSCRN